MNELERKYQLLAEEDLQFARGLAARVIANPKLSVWMILIPIIFVHFFYQKERYRSGCEEFVRHFMVSRKRALDAVRDAASRGGAPDFSLLVSAARVEPGVRDAYEEFLRVLAGHYQDMLAAAGASIGELARNAYGVKTNYLLFCNRLHNAEKTLAHALEAHSSEVAEGYGEAVKKIEQASGEMRRQRADELFA